MTKFWRNGFHRTGRYGDTHWVEGHSVERNIWDRGGAAQTALSIRNTLISLRVNASAAARYVVPNASCPVCGDLVFFFQNEYGSRVYFDDLSPPWPKHPCTDQPRYEKSTGATGKRVVPAFRDPAHVDHIDDLLSFADADPEYDFGEKYGTGPWSAWQVQGRYRGISKSALVLHSVDAGTPRTLFLAGRRMPAGIKAGALVYFYRGWLACFDLTTMKPHEIQVEKLRNASAFVEALVFKSQVSK